MIDLEKLILDAKLRNSRKKKKSDAIHELIINSSSPEMVIDRLKPEEMVGLSKDILKKKVKGYRNLYDYILKKVSYNIVPSEDDIKDVELVQTFLENRNTIMDRMISDELWLSKMPDGRLVIDIILNVINFYFDIPFIGSVDVAKELIKRSRFYLLENVSIDVLKCEIDNKTILEILLEHKIVPGMKYVTCSNDMISSRNYNNDCLLEEIKNGKKTIDYLLDSSLMFNFDFDGCVSLEDDINNWKQIAKICIQCNRFDKISKACEKFFIQEVTLDDGRNGTIFDFVKKSKFKPIVVGDINNPEIIKYFLEDRNRYMDLIIKCSADTLTKAMFDGVSPLEAIILKELSANKKMDSIIRTLYYFNKYDERVSLLFAKWYLYIPPIHYVNELGLTKGGSVEQYLYKQFSFPIFKEYSKVIDTFKKIFDDGVSDQTIVNSVISSFALTMTSSPAESVRDIQALIDYKTQYPDFALKYASYNGSSFLSASNSFSSGYISLDNAYDISSFNHEWGHLIHEAYDNSSLPQDIEELIIYDNRYYLENFDEINGIFHQISDEAEQLLSRDLYSSEFIKFVESKKGSVDKYREEIKEEYRNLLGSNNILFDGINCNFSHEVLKALCSACFEDNKDEYLSDDAVNKYVNERLRAEEKIFLDIYYMKVNSEFLCYENFLDAYYGGALGDVIKSFGSNVPTCTHNSKYFFDKKQQFGEMFAIYVQLKKSDNGGFYIEKLKEKTSSKLIDAIEAYYKSIGMDKEKFSKNSK